MFSFCLVVFQIGVGLSIDDLLVLGQYQMSAWFTRSKGNFSVNIIKVLAEAEVGFMVDNDGILQVQEVNMDVKFGDIKMNFENLGFLGSVFQVGCHLNSQDFMYMIFKVFLLYLGFKNCS